MKLILFVLAILSINAQTCNPINRQLSIGRYASSSASIGNYVIIAGGVVSSNSIVANTDILDFQNQQYITTSTISTPRAHFASTVVGSLLLFGGGQSSNTYHSTVDSYNYTSKTWNTISFPTTIGRSYLAATTVGNRAIFGGGRISSTVSTSIVDVYDLSSGWSNSIGNLSVARERLAAVSLGPCAFFAGGAASPSATVGSNRVDVYNILNNSWTVMNLSSARHSLAATSVGSKVLFGGGLSGTTWSRTVDIYDIITKSWTSSNALNPAASNLAASTSGLKAYFGGGTDGSTGLRDVNVYDVNSGSWTSVSGFQDDRAWLTSVAVSDGVLFIGGADDDGSLTPDTGKVWAAIEKCSSGCNINCGSGFEPISSGCTCQACSVANCDRCYNGVCFFCKQSYFLNSTGQCQPAVCGAACLCGYGGFCYACQTGSNHYYSSALAACYPCTTCAVNQYQISDCSSTDNRVCANCTSCGATQYQVSECSSTANGVCANCMANCASCSSGTTCSACNSGFYWSGSACVVQTCPSYASGAPACTCNSGYLSTLAWDSASQNYTGSCSLALCPDNASGAPSCVCDSGYYGALSFIANSWSGSCSACSSCTLGSTFETSPCTVTSNRVCSACSSCTLGSTFETSPCTVTSNRVCSACSICAAGEYQSSSCTLTTDGTCSDCADKCVSCTSGSTCSSCLAGFHWAATACVACANCSVDTYETTACTTGTNRVCSACTTCGQSQFESTPCTPTANRQCSNCPANCGSCTNGTSCASCNSGFYWDGSACAACLTCTGGSTYETTPCTTASNRVCSGCSNCNNGFYESSACIVTANRGCSSCMANCELCMDGISCNACANEFYWNGSACDACVTCQSGFSFETTACSHNGNRVCSVCTTCGPNQYQSTNCSLTQDRQCQSCSANCESCVSATSCLSCNNGHFWDGSACLACGTCENGTYEAAPCSTANNRLCSVCPQGCSTCTSAATCQTCQPGYFQSAATCVACTVCSGATYLSQACSQTTDSVCTVCDVGCPLGQYQSAPCTATANRVCSVSSCPPLSSGSPCVCDRGYYGTLLWNSSVALWEGSCAVRECPADSDGHPSCVCRSDHVGTISWDATTQLWVGACVARACVLPYCDVCQRDQVSSVSQCISCQSGYYLNNISLTAPCSRCASGCRQCTSVNTCLSCVTGFTPDSLTKSCNLGGSYIGSLFITADGSTSRWYDAQQPFVGSLRVDGPTSVERKSLVLSQLLSLTSTVSLARANGQSLLWDPTNLLVDYTWTRQGTNEVYKGGWLRVPVSQLEASTTARFELTVSLLPQGQYIDIVDLSNINDWVNTNQDIPPFTSKTLNNIDGFGNSDVTIQSQYSGIIHPQLSGVLSYEYQISGMMATTTNTGSMGGIYVEENEVAALMFNASTITFGGSALGTASANRWYSFKITVSKTRLSANAATELVVVNAKVWDSALSETPDAQAKLFQFSRAVLTHAPALRITTVNSLLLFSNLALTNRRIAYSITRDVIILPSTLSLTLNQPTSLSLSTSNSLEVTTNAIDFNIAGLPNQDALYNNHLQYTWSCDLCVFPPLTNLSVGNLVVPVQAVGSYVLTATVLSTYLQPARSASATVLLNYVDNQVAEVSIVWRNPSVSLVNGRSIQLLGVVSLAGQVVPLNSTRFTYFWNETSENFFGNSLITTRALTLNTSLLTPAKPYTFTLTVIDQTNGNQSFAAITLPAVDAPPVPGRCDVLHVTTGLPVPLDMELTPLLPVVINCSGWTTTGQNSELFYTFYAESSSNSIVNTLVVDSRSAEVMVYLPTGDIDIFVIVKNGYGSSSQLLIRKVRVLPLASLSDITKAIDLLNSLDISTSPAQILTILNNLPLTSLEITNIMHLLTQVTDLANDQLVADLVNIISRLPSTLLDTNDTNLYHDLIKIIDSVVSNGGVSSRIAPVLTEVLSNLLETAPCDVVNRLTAALGNLTSGFSETVAPDGSSLQVQGGNVLSGANSLYSGQSADLTLLGLQFNLSREMLSLASVAVGFGVVNLGNITRCRPGPIVGPILDVNLYLGDEAVRVTNLSTPFRFTIPYVADSVAVKKCSNSPQVPLQQPVCSWWDPINLQWNVSGCTTGGQVQVGQTTHIECFCTHLTEFALLLENAQVDCAEEVDGFKAVAAMYAVVGFVGLVQSIRLIIARSGKLVDQLLLEHVLVVLVAAGRCSASAYFAGLVTYSTFGLAFVLSFPYMFVFWIFFILIFQWANIYHLSIGELNSGAKKFRPVFLTSGLLISLSIAVLFLTYVIDGVEGETAKKIGLAASIFVGFMYLVSGVTFYFYGSRVAQQLAKGMSMSSTQSTYDLQPGLEPSLCSVMKQNWDRLPFRMHVYCALISCAFVLASLMWILSSIFINQATNFAYLFYVVEATSVCAVMLLFSNAVKLRVDQRARAKTATVSRGSTGRVTEMTSNQGEKSPVHRYTTTELADRG